MGEAYKALKESDGWSRVGFSDSLSLWMNAVVFLSPLIQLDSTLYGLRLQAMEPSAQATQPFTSPLGMGQQQSGCGPVRVVRSLEGWTWWGEECYTLSVCSRMCKR